MYLVIYKFTKYVFWKKNIIFLISCFVVQYLIINSNPYKDFDTDKMTILDYIPEEYKPKSEYFDKNKEYKYPFIIKPTVCSRDGNGVKLIKNRIELQKYLKKNINVKLMVQEYIDNNKEIGISYKRNPLSNSGKITFIGNRFLDKNSYDTIYGVTDILRHLFNISKKYVHDTKFLYTKKLENTIDKISKGIPDFYLGRYDILYKNVNDLRMGKNFYIVEANGTMVFFLSMTYSNIFEIIIKSIEWFFYRIYYGFLNIISLNGVSPTIIIRSIINAINCRDWEKLFSVYT